MFTPATVAYFLIVLTLLGVLSPLLTFTALFQQKEWRLDRLKEHVRREGAWGQLIGKSRGIVIGIYAACAIAAIIASFYFRHIQDSELILTAGSLLLIGAGLCLCAFAGLSVTQILLHKQRMPVWTKKAILIVLLSACITVVYALLPLWFLYPVGTLILFSLPLLIVLQPVSVLLSWFLLQPIDLTLKRRIFTQARLLRERHPEWTVIAIAGSVGKTTTKELLRHLLQDLSPTTTPAHVNTEMGVAEWMLAELQEEATHPKPVIVEMGAYRTGEIKLMCSFVQPTMGVMTALGSDHLALFGSEEAIIEANGELIEALPEHGHAFLNGDNDACRLLADRALCSVTLVGQTPESSLRAEHTTQTNDGLTFHLGSPSPTADRSPLIAPIHGLHNISNILLAVAVAQHLGIAETRIRELLASFRPLSHTFHVRTERGVLLVDDTYNASRLSFHAGLQWAGNRPERPRVLLTSGLLETGAKEEEFMRELGKAAQSNIERVIFTTVSNKTAFEEGFGHPAEQHSPTTPPVSTGSLLLCIGRMPLSSIERLLP